VEAERADIGGGGGTLAADAVVPACGVTAVRWRPREVGGFDGGGGGREALAPVALMGRPMNEMKNERYSMSGKYGSRKIL